MTKQERFVKLAEKRTNKILRYIRTLGNLSNTRVYEFTEEQVEKMFSEVEKNLQRIKIPFYLYFDKKSNYKFKLK